MYENTEVNLMYVVYIVLIHKSGIINVSPKYRSQSLSSP